MSKVIESDCGNVTILADDSIPNEIGVTDTAKFKITELLKDEDGDTFLSVGVSGGGCSGFQYIFGLHNEIDEDDIINEWEGGKLVVDSMSITYMKGATIDFIDNFEGEHFSVENPEATSQCGCNNSFNI